MKLLLSFLLFGTTLFAADVFDVFDHKWTVPVAADWKIDQEGGTPILHLVVGKEPPSNLPRRPMQFALADTPDFSQVTVEADVKPLQRSLIIVFAYKDPAHFNYAHISVDTGTKQPVHNGIFHVFGGERVRISSQQGPAAFAASGHWYHVVLKHNGGTGSVQVQVDGTPVPALHAVDFSLMSGRVGIGSFDETGDFKNVKITGVPAS
jgi:hypothetical protein